MFIIEGLISGLIATIIFDIFQQSLNFAYGIEKPKWELIGRYFLGYKRGIFNRVLIIEDELEKNELFWGYLIHYLIGAVYGIFYVSLNELFFTYPSILVAYFVGFISVLGAWCYLMPFAFNLGFFASKSENRLKIMSQNLISHFVFGTGLFIGLYAIY
jgi:hypothetical protein